jgi:hypothetical protein
MLLLTLLQGCNALSQHQLEANLSGQPAKEDITTVINTARGRPNAVTTSMAPSR